MTSIKISNDDSGLRSLQQTNKTPATTGPVQAIAPAKPLAASSSKEGLKPRQAWQQQPVVVEHHRRQDNRRKKDIPVLLDTRSQHDRRVKGKADEGEIKVSPLRGINEIT